MEQHKEHYERYVRETIEFYGEDPDGRRSSGDNGGTCYYRGFRHKETGLTDKKDPDPRRAEEYVELNCAVARVATPAALDFFHQVEDTFDAVMRSWRGLSEEAEHDPVLALTHPKELLTVDGVPYGDNECFWSDLQEIHDDGCAWVKRKPAYTNFLPKDQPYPSSQYLAPQKVFSAFQLCRRHSLDPRNAIPGWTEAFHEAFMEVHQQRPALSWGTRMLVALEECNYAPV